MRRMFAALLLAGAAPASACDSPGPHYARLESTHFVVWMATQPATVPVGAEFSVDAVLCRKDETGVAAVRFDAWMPIHRHGMNSRPSVKPTGDARWRADGFLFHMPGRWQFTIEVDTAEGRERLTRDLVVE